MFNAIVRSESTQKKKNRKSREPKTNRFKLINFYEFNFSHNQHG